MARGHLGLAVAAASVALSVTVPLSDATAHQANRFASPSMASTPPNICGTNATIGQAFLAAVNLSYPGLEAAKEAAKLNDLAGVCDAVVKYYRQGTSASWFRIGPVAPGHGRVGGAVDAMVDNDTFAHFPSPSYPVKIPRNADGGLQWTWYGPDNDDEFMNVLNRHEYFNDLLEAWNSTGNSVYPQYFDALVKDWVLHLPCNHAQHGGTNRCVPLGDQSGGPVCKWDPVTHGGACDTGTFESPWRSLEMGIRMAGWPVAFYGFQQSDNFSVDARVLMLLGVSEHLQALEVDGGHPGSGTVNWEMTQWRGLLVAAGAWPELAGAAEASQVSFKYLTKLLESGVYPDGVENEMTSNYDMGTAADYYSALVTVVQAGLPAPPASFSTRVEAMYTYGAYVASPSGCLPQNGDSDLCSTGGFVAGAAAFFNRSDWEYVRTNGAQGRVPSGPEHSTPSVMFPWAGQAVLRESYEAGAAYMWMDVGPFGSNPFHAHRDKLSIQLHAHGALLLADSGRFAYAGTSFSHDRRPYAHDTHAHNTLRIDGMQQQQAPALATAPRPNTSWSFEADRDVVQGSMSLWDGLKGEATHSRSVWHQRGEWFVVVDVVSSDRPGRTVQATWHCHPNASVTLDPGSNRATVVGVDSRTALPSSARVAVVPATGGAAASWASAKVVKGQLKGQDNATEDQGWYSASYADASPAPVLVYDAALGATTRAVFGWLLLPSSGPAPSPATLAITALGSASVSATVTIGAKTWPIEVPIEV